MKAYRKTLHKKGTGLLTSGGRLLQFDLLSRIYPLILLHTAEDELSNKNKAYLSSFFSYWAMNIWTKYYWKYRQLPHVPNEMYLMYPIFMQFKTACIDNCLYIAFETFANNNFILLSYLKRNVTAV